MCGGVEERGIHVETRTETLIHVAACGVVRKECFGFRSNVNAKGRDGQTPLHFATRNNRPICVDTLLENGADANLSI